MQNLNATEEQLRLIIREELTNALKKEFMKVRLTLIPEISREEQKEIEDLYGEPSFDEADSVELNV